MEYHLKSLVVPEYESFSYQIETTQTCNYYMAPYFKDSDTVGVQD